MAKNIYKRKGNFKGLLFVSGLVIIAIILIYTQHQVNLLQEKSTEYLRFRIRIFEENINNPDTNTDLSFFFTEVIQGTDYPIIYTDTSMIPLLCKNINAELDAMPVLNEAAVHQLEKQLRDMDDENTPIPIKFQGIKLGYYHYGVSPIIKTLRWLPYVEIAAAILFILIGYAGFSQIKKSEQRYIWVGMAKETAHQLGTPISSIFGWLEILKEDKGKLDQAREEMETDARRLNKVASRFSQIGSVPSLKNTEVVNILHNVVTYFSKRLPQLDKKISIEEDYQFHVTLKLNSDLFEWVIENLIKNSIDAFDGKNGTILLKTSKSADEANMHIDVCDNGKGISNSDRNNIFKPGFSTKSRGWGLGLSLAKRIIEDYHGGKLFIKDSRLGEGTTIRISLKNV